MQWTLRAPNLTRSQRDLLQSWLPGAETVRDHSWGLVGTTVLEILHEGRRHIVKAGDADDHHIARELRAHRNWLGPWLTRGRAPRLVHADRDAKLLVTRYLPGELVQGRGEEHSPEVYRQAGELLAALHGQTAVEDTEFESAARDKAHRWLDRPHRIAPEIAGLLRADLESWPTPPAPLVPTHGDWQPRNWLMHGGVVSVIDFGRADLRPARTDFTRLAAQQFRSDPSLEAAFLHGYGPDPREPAAWRRTRVCEAIGTAVWAFQVGDERFEQQGHRMIAEVLAEVLADDGPPAPSSSTTPPPAVRRYPRTTSRRFPGVTMAVQANATPQPDPDEELPLLPPQRTAPALPDEEIPELDEAEAPPLSSDEIPSLPQSPDPDAPDSPGE